MTPERCKELLPVMQGFAEGNVVQFRGKGCEGWIITTDPDWSEGVDYRLKPEPRTWWLAVWPSGEVAYSSQIKQFVIDRTKMNEDLTMVEVQEVLL